MKIKKQLDAKDCGPLVLQAIHHHYYKKWIKINEIKLKVDFGTKGVNIKNFIRLSNKYGVEMEAYEATLDAIVQSMPDKYMVALIDSEGMNHYVIFKYKDRKFYISDSIKGKYILSQFEFSKLYKGTVLTVQKGKYVPEEIDITHPIKYLSKNWNLIGWITASLIISLVFTFVTSLYMKIILDKVIPGKLNSTLIILSLSFAFLAILRAINKVFRSYLVKKLSLQIEKDLTFTYFEQLTSVSFKDLSKITINDNLRRIGMVAHVSGFIANSFFVVVNEFAMLVVSASLLIWISPTLFGVSFASAGILCLITIIFKIFTRSKYDDLIKNQMNLFNSMVDSVNQIQELKDPKISKINNKLFTNRFKTAKTKEYEIWNLNNLQQVFENIIQFVIPIFLVYLGAHSVFSGKMTMGLLLMFITIFNSFIQPVKDLCEFFLQLPQMQKNVDLISLIINLPKEMTNSKGLKLDKLKTIKLKNFSSGYDRKIIHIDDMTIDGNIHLKGKNGTGKSTFLNSISTILNSKGGLYFNKYDKDFYSLEDIRTKIINISPSTYIPNISVFEYATLGDKYMTKLFIKNLKKYNILGLLNSLSLSLETPLINNGQNISSGQRQVVTLLRLFSYKYELIILDEAFENIDPNKLKGIKKAINHFQDSIFIEVSHSGKYISKGKEVDIEEINKHSY